MRNRMQGSVQSSQYWQAPPRRQWPMWPVWTVLVLIGLWIYGDFMTPVIGGQPLSYEYRHRMNEAEALLQDMKAMVERLKGRDMFGSDSPKMWQAKAEHEAANLADIERRLRALKTDGDPAIIVNLKDAVDKHLPAALVKLKDALTLAQKALESQESVERFSTDMQGYGLKHLAEASAHLEAAEESLTAFKTQISRRR